VPRDRGSHGGGLAGRCAGQVGGLCGRAERSCSELGVADGAPGSLRSWNPIPTSPGRRIRMTMLRICSARRAGMTS